MSYPRGLMDSRVTIYHPVQHESAYGRMAAKYEPVKEIWAWVTFVRGARALHHGDMTVYQSRMIRCDAHSELTQYSRLCIDGKYYVIDSINTDRQRNECQITAYEVENIDQTIHESNAYGY